MRVGRRSAPGSAGWPPRCGCRALGARRHRARAARRARAGAPTSCATRGFTWDTGPSLLTMPWVLEETFAAGGLDLHSEVDAAAARPALPDPLGRRGARTSTSPPTATRLRAEVARFSAARRRAASSRSWRRCAPIYERRRSSAPGGAPFLRAARLRAARARRWSGSTRCGRCTRFVARHFEHPRVREAFSFHSLFIGGDPFRVPAIYGALVYLQVARRRLVRRRRRVLAWSRRWPRPLDVRCGEPVERDRARRRPRDAACGWPAASGSPPTSWSPTPTCCARTSCSGRRPPRRRLRETMSCFLLYLGTDRALRAAAAPHAARRRRLPRVHPRRHARPRAAARPSRPTSTRRRAPSRRWRRPAATRSRPAAGPQPARGDRLGARGATGCATRSWPTSRRPSAWTGSTRPSSSSTG